jgi:hypothetical protein
MSGEADQIAESINRFFHAGFHEVIVYPAPNSPEAISALEPVVAALKDEQ